MDIINLTIILFIGWSLTSLIVNGNIFDEIREYFVIKSPFLYKLLSCIQCTGFWVGVLLLIPLIYTGKIYLIYPIHWVNYIAYPIMQSGFGVIVESIIIHLVKTQNKN